MYINNLRAIKECLLKNDIAIELIVFSKGKRIEELIELAQKNKIKIIYEKKNLNINPLKKPALLKVKQLNNNKVEFNYFLDELKENDEAKCVLLIDKIKDPQNLGNIIRTCELFAVDLLILTKRNTAPINETVINASVGAINYINYTIVPNLSYAVEQLKKNDFWVYSSQMDGDSIVDKNFESRTCLILGSEGQGVSNRLENEADFYVSIPQLGQLDSFNVASACAILLYEVRKKQGFLNNL